MADKGLSPKEAAIESMREVTGAIIAIELVLCSVFVPVAFLGGLAGRLYQQFAVTVTTAVVISGVVALTLTPALCALLLKPSHEESRIFRPFNQGFAWLVSLYTNGVRWVANHALIALGIFALVIACTGWLLRLVPGSLVPPEDQGYLFGAVVLPDGATLSRTGKVGAAMQKILTEHPAAEHVFMINGFDLIGGGNKTSSATLFITLKPWDDRSASAEDIVKFVGAKGAAVSEGLVFAFSPVPIRGLGTAGGMEMFLQSRASADAKKLAETVQQFLGDLRKRPDLTATNSFFRASVPQLFVEVDREKALSLGVPISDIFDALQSTMGALYVNDFNKFGRTYRVQMQAEPQFRVRPEDLGNVYVRSATSGEMLPIKSMLQIQPIVGPDQIDRFNGFVAAKVLAATVPGVSSGQGIAAVEQVAREALPDGYFLEWIGQAFQEKRAGKAAIIAFCFALVMVFLILSANYERWSLPVAVLLSVPFAILGALLAVLVRGMSNDIYFQIGLVTLIGLAAKNAILIVEFAAQNAAKGMSAFDAAVTAARQRFRPIVMTSLAFVLGVLPLAIASRAGAAALRSDWWRLYNEPKLDELVASALERNADIRFAVARIEEADANLRAANAAFLPEIDLGANANQTRSSTTTVLPVPPGVPVVRNDVRLALSTSFELDFWGRLRRSAESVRAQMLATRYARDVVALTLEGLTAQAYFALRSLDAQLIVTRETISPR